MLPENFQDDDDSCDCMNCRLKRMEAAIDEMHESVHTLLEMKMAGQAITGMPEGRNRIKAK
jgi:hypothetical protein